MKTIASVFFLLSVFIGLPFFVHAGMITGNGNIGQALPIELDETSTIYQFDDGRVAVIGGYRPDSGLIKDVYFLTPNGASYDLSQQTQLPKGVFGSSAFEIDHTLYIFGGTTDNVTAPHRSAENPEVYRYDSKTNSFLLDSKSDAPNEQWVAPYYTQKNIFYFSLHGHVMRYVAAVPAGNRYALEHPEHLDLYVPKFGWVEQNIQPADPIAQLYRDVLQREPDGAGLIYWQKRFAGGLPLSSIREAFLNSPEYTRKQLTI